MAADQSGNVFVAGDNGTITKTADHGASWTRIMHTEVQTYMALAAARVEISPATESSAAVSQDQVVAAGYTPSGQWLTRRSVDAGDTWETVDVIPALGDENINGAAIDSAGNIYVTGAATITTTAVVKNKTTTTTSNYWRIRKIARDATSGSELGKTTFDLTDATGGYAAPKSITCVGTNVFVAGVSGDRWQVRKLGGGQTQWALIDNYRYHEGYSSEASAIAADPAGNLYVVGKGVTGTGKVTANHWIVRRGTGAGTTSPTGAISFSNVDDQSSAANGSAAYGVCVDPSGNVYVTGKGGNWVTRRHAATAPLTSWVTSDSGFGQIGWDVVSDSSGNTFSAGWTADSDWVIRRLLAP